MQNYASFYEEEIAARRLGLYPPFCEICLVGFTGTQQKRVLAAARRFSQSLGALAKKEYPQLPLRVLGPSEASVLRIAGNTDISCWSSAAPARPPKSCSRGCWPHFTQKKKTGRSPPLSTFTTTPVFNG
jgi:primosomal protein N'